MKTTARKIAPIIESDEEAGKFWLENDTTDYVDWSKAERPNRTNAVLVREEELEGLGERSRPSEGVTH